eukprot:m.23466 g.23466  ORF g.23466 m.23466 type:complete len:214 (+) comp28482_c0_seq2:706-1347(+)
MEAKDIYDEAKDIYKETKEAKKKWKEAMTARQQHICGSTSKQILTIFLHNFTKYPLIQPQLTVFHGVDRTERPFRRVYPNEERHLTIASRPTGRIVEIEIALTILSGKTLVIFIRMALPFCCGVSSQGGWIAELVDPRERAEKKKEKRFQKRLRRLFRTEGNEADCSEYTKEWPDESIKLTGIMGSSNHPILLLNVVDDHDPSLLGPPQTAHL